MFKRVAAAFLTFSLVLFGFFTPSTVQALPDHAVLLLSTENKEAVVGNQVYYDLLLNTLGKEVAGIDVQFLIRGPFDRQSMSFNLHPDHREHVRSSPMKVIQYERFLEGDDSVRVHVVLKTADGKPFNEGSSAMPMYRVSLRVNGEGTIRGYIDQTHSYVYYVDPNRQDYSNFTPESDARLIKVYAGGYSASPVVSPVPELQVEEFKERQPSLHEESPRPWFSATPQASPQLMMVEEKNQYDAEFERMTNEIESLRTQVNAQEKRLTIVERIVQGLRNFFGKIL